jgi:molybdopterin/thiamine biosynthesis adenylyltransferase
VAHLFQVGAGSGGMPVLDLLCRDPRLTRVTLVEPDVYKPHNVERHLFPLTAVGELKAVLAERWLAERRPDLKVRCLVCDLRDPERQQEIDEAAAAADIGVCAADNELAKFHWDALMRRHAKPWTLGEVLSGGIGGFVHWFVPGGPCYGCVAGHLQRAVVVDNSPAPDYSAPNGPVTETTVPASKASIQAIASLHALVTLALLDHVVGRSGDAPVIVGRSGDAPGVPGLVASAAGPAGYDPGFTSLLLSLRRVPEVFEEAFRPYRFRVPRAADCLICRAPLDATAPEELDVALDQALARLGDA